jgi:hypothetical protein
MGVNDDRLSAGEQNELRALVTAGAGRMRAARRRRMQAITGGAAVLLVAAVVGAVALTAMGSPDRVANPVETTTTPAPTPTATPAPTPEPTATEREETPAAVRGIEPFGGDCNNALTTEEVSELYGVQMKVMTPAWSDGSFALQGGLSCSWSAADGSGMYRVGLSAFPSSVVGPYAAALQPPAGCDVDSWGCFPTTERDGVWLQIWDNSVVPAPDTTGLAELASARAGEWPSPAPAVRTANWWDSVACEDIVAAVDVAGALGVDNAFLDNPDPVQLPEGKMSVSDILTERGGVVPCTFSLGIYAAHVETIPGGAAYTSDIGAADVATPMVVRGGYAAWALPDDDLWERLSRYVVVSDGVNLIRVSTSNVDSTPSDDALGELGVRVIEALNGTVG